jgi:hypothetical protein
MMVVDSNEVSTGGVLVSREFRDTENNPTRAGNTEKKVNPNFQAGIKILG